MSIKNVSIEDFEKLLLEICDAETSMDPGGWTEKNPLWGHCAVVSLLAQDIFGGELLRVSLEGTAFAQMKSHYYNRLLNSDKTEKDFTREQFGGNYPAGLEVTTRTREYVLSYPPTAKRYELLKSRLRKLFGDENA